MSTTVEAPAVPRLKQRYRDEIVDSLREEFGYANVMQVPAVTKVVVNMGVGDAARDSKLIEGAIRDLQSITGQRPAVTKARAFIGDHLGEELSLEPVVWIMYHIRGRGS